MPRLDEEPSGRGVVPHTLFMTLTCLNPDAFNRVMRPPSSD